MQYDAQKHQAQQLELVMTTIFTCRSVVKYNLALDEEQKEDVLQDIDASLEVLRTFALANMVVEQNLATLQPSHAGNAMAAFNHGEAACSDVNAHKTLQELYRMYYAFINMNQQTNLQSFVSRFNEVISVLGEVQRLFEQNCSPYNLYFSSVQTNYAALPTVAENLLRQAKNFISDLYYVFMDFIRILSSILQQNDVQLDTEKLGPAPERRSEKIRSIQLQRIQEPASSVQGIQEAYQQLRRRRLQVEPQISETATFLECLEQIPHAIDGNRCKLGEIRVQTDTVTRLLAELIHIIADYEKITSLLLSMG